MNIFKRYLELNLNIKIIFSIVCGALFGLLFPGFAEHLNPISMSFVRLLKMLVVPLVLVSLILGVYKLGDLKHVSTLGLKTLFYFIATTLIAILIGLIMALYVAPGNQTQLIEDPESLFIMNPDPPIYMDRFIEQVIPENLFLGIVEGNILSVILIAILIGLAILAVGKEGDTMARGFESFHHIILKITNWVMKLAPLGIFALISGILANSGLEAIKSLALYMICVLIALSIYSLLISTFLLKYLGNYSPIKLFQKMFSALSTVFSTSSSSATFPVTLKCLTKGVGIPNKITSFVLPLGTTLNMDGTAIYQTIAVIFMAQVFDIQLTLFKIALIVSTTILASIGTAGIPSSGLFTLVLVLNAVGIPLQGISMILAIDPILDMFRSTVNVWGDACASVIVARFEGEKLN